MCRTRSSRRPAVPHTLTGKRLEVPIKKLLAGKPLEKAANIASVDNPDALRWYARFAAERLADGAAPDETHPMAVPRVMAPRARPPDALGCDARPPVARRRRSRWCRWAKRLVDAGFESLWVPQIIGRGYLVPDPFVTLAAAAAATEGVELGTATVQVPLHHPADLAHRVLSLQSGVR